MPSIRGKTVPLLVVFLCVASLAGCGKRPSSDKSANSGAADVCRKADGHAA